MNKTPQTSPPLRILLVEDNEHDRLAFRRALRKGQLPCEITECIRAEDALERIRANTSLFDLLVIDHGLPGMSGLDLCKTLVDEETPWPLVLLTGGGSEQLAVEALKAGVDDYIIKDTGQGYLELLPVVLLDVVQKYNDRLAHKRSEEALRESEERLKILFEFAPDAYYLNDLRGNFVDGNKAAEELIGYKKEELIGKNFLKSKLLSLNQIPKAVALLAQNVLGKPTRPDEFTLNKKDGNRVPVEISTFPVKIKGQTLVLGIARDITERKRAEEQIKASLEEKEVLLREIHHRVKNNLQIVSSLLYLQGRKSIKDEQTLEIFNETRNRIYSMALVHEKLYQEESLANIDFVAYIRELVNSLFSSYGVNSAAITHKISADGVSLNINTAMPCSLILNELVSNSLKHAFPEDVGSTTPFHREKGEIRIDCRKDTDDRFILIVSDNGVGFPKDVDWKNTESLGLQLVNNLVSHLDGIIELTSNGGTEFKITFKELKYKKRS